MNELCLNDSNNIKLRKYRDYLIIIGIGIILFGLWIVLKNTVSIIMGNHQVKEFVAVAMEFDDGTLSEYIEEDLLVDICTVLLIVYMILSMIIRLYLGRCAIKEAKTGKRGSFYLIVAGLYTIFYAVDIVMYFMSISQHVQPLIDIFVSVVIELTSLFIMVELIVSVVSVRRLAKEDILYEPISKD